MEIHLDTSTELGKLLSDTSKEKPTKEAKQALHEYIVKHGGDELARIGNLAQRAQDNIIEGGFKTNYGFRQTVLCYLIELKLDLGYDAALPLEQMLINHICLCWLRLHDVELRYENMRQGNPSIAQMEHWEKRLNAAHQRFLKATEALAKVRRLMKDPPNPLTLALIKQQIGR